MYALVSDCRPAVPQCCQDRPLSSKHNSQNCGMHKFHSFALSMKQYEQKYVLLPKHEYPLLSKHNTRQPTPSKIPIFRIYITQLILVSLTGPHCFSPFLKSLLLPRSLGSPERGYLSINCSAQTSHYSVFEFKNGLRVTSSAPRDKISLMTHKNITGIK